ncbi:hypothetical protein BT69DRAFT_1286107 [Atractiella rhizophila]|nr:hypothetical protein BT69DRAFT_1286107 [Atractiella rhizophila]
MTGATVLSPSTEPQQRFRCDESSFLRQSSFPVLTLAHCASSLSQPSLPPAST